MITYLCDFQTGKNIIDITRNKSIQEYLSSHVNQPKSVTVSTQNTATTTTTTVVPSLPNKSKKPNQLIWTAIKDNDLEMLQNLKQDQNIEWNVTNEVKAIPF